MKFKEITQLGREEQENKLKEFQLELIKLNAQVATGTPPKNSGQLRRLKKDIARIMLTIGNKKLSDKKLESKQKPKGSGKKEIPAKTAKKQLNKQNE
jgi:ribosomal protein L29